MILHQQTVPGNSITQFSKHDIRKIERINPDVVTRNPTTIGTDNYAEYHQLTNGIIKLRKLGIDAEYVWIVVQRHIVDPSVDYYLQDDRQTVRIVTDINANDVVELIHFPNDVIVPKFGYRQFKDMLNRTHFKRLGDDVEYTLAEDLNWYDTKIFVTNYDDLSIPNKDKQILALCLLVENA